MHAGPTVAEERALMLRARKLPVPEVPWRANGPLWSVGFFALTALALTATFWLFGRFDLPEGWLTGAVALTLAEVLIRKYRFFGTGIESALWIGGLFAVILGLRGSSRPEALLLLAAACALAGFRMRNPVFGGAAAAFVVAYLAARHLHALAAMLGIVVSLVALAVLRRELQRPSTEWLLYALLLVTPVAGAVASIKPLGAAWAIAYVAAAVVCVAVGLTVRAHAPLIAAAIHTAIAVTTLVEHAVLPFPPEWKLIAGGVLVFALSAVLTRELRGRQTGIVSTPTTLTGLDQTIEIAATIGMPQHRTSPAEPTRESGGEFGGAGASGRF